MSHILPRATSERRGAAIEVRQERELLDLLAQPEENIAGKVSGFRKGRVGEALSLSRKQPCPGDVVPNAAAMWSGQFSSTLRL